MSGADQRRRLTAPLRLRNYRSVVGTLRTYQRPVEALSRYVRGTGEYPWTATLRTPIGRQRLLVPHPHDVRTVNEVFCRHDYGGGSPRVVVDVGANIGVSALYFLTRRPDAVVHAWEPLASNLATLRRNLEPFAGRVHVHERALAPESGPATFLAEAVGRYSGLAQWSTTSDDRTAIEVQCEAVDAALADVIVAEGGIDLLKVDTEGSEEALVAAISPSTWLHIGEVVYERPGGVVRRSGASFLPRH